MAELNVISMKPSAQSYFPAQGTIRLGSFCMHTVIAILAPDAWSKSLLGGEVVS